MGDVTRLGGGYAESRAEAGPTVSAVLDAARAGSPEARLVIISGPPGVGKSAVCRRLMELTSNCFLVDKDMAAAGFILAAAAAAGHGDRLAYGTHQYWRELRPLEYGGALSLACANLVGPRTVLAAGGWGPELAVDDFWPDLKQRLAPSRLVVVHLDPPDRESWRRRMAGRGSRSDAAWFEEFASSVTAFGVWSGAVRVSTEPPLGDVVQSVLVALERDDEEWESDR